jgi:ApaG protein
MPKPSTQYSFAIQVATNYLVEQSKPEQNQFAFSYTVTFTNTGSVPAQLISRHWIIDDANGTRREVKGLGVVGHQPYMEPGQSFEYTSGTPLETASGKMHGSFFFVAEDGERFDVAVAEFELVQQRTLH